VTLATASPPVVKALVAKLREKPDYPRVLGIHAQPVWHHEPELSVNGDRVLVRPCLSPLAVREALIEHGAAGDAAYLVVVTDCTDDDLGAGIRAHLARGRLFEVNLWETVQASFRATHLDNAFVARDKEWAPLALVEHEPAGGWPEAPGGRLTRDFGLSQLAAAILGVQADHIDASSLLRWSADAVATRRYLDLEAPVRDGLSAWLVERLGAPGALTLSAASAGHASDSAALALVGDLLWHDDAAAAEVGIAQGMFATKVGGQPPTRQDAQAWGRAAKVFVSAELDARSPAGHAVVERAEQLIDELHARSIVPLSRFLPSGLDHRLRLVATALHTTLPTPTGATLRPVETALEAVGDHELSIGDPRVETVTMAVRLTRWLAVAAALRSHADEVGTLADALDRQVRVDAWVDRAFADIYTGDPDPDLARTYSALSQSVSSRRATHDQQLAVMLAEAMSSEADLGRIVPVEQALARIVRPLASGDRGVLFVLVDGMSTAVATEIADGLAGRRWTELVQGTFGARQALLPVLPTLTELSRTSLLTGRLMKGHDKEEKKFFPEAVGLPASLFHKDDLRAPAGAALSPRVADAIADPAMRVVGVVLNSVDDTLHKLDPGGTTWTLETVQHLPALLDAARAADRLVVLTSDHGHVVERASALTSYPGVNSPRWRLASPAPTDGEVLVTGQRVLLGGGTVVMPWRENLRYAAKAAGYHGGASAAEVAIPITVHVRGPVTSVGGWVPATPAAPPWWHSPLAPDRPAVVAVEQPVVVVEATPTLFDEQSVSPVAGDMLDGLLDALFSSDVYADQRRRSGRSAPDDERVRAIVAALLRNDGRLHSSTLAGITHIPEVRLRNVLAAVRKLLNVEGYDVVGVDVDQVTIVLDVALLREQFHLGRPS
jgi:hypothetical protein